VSLLRQSPRGFADPRGRRNGSGGIAGVPTGKYDLVIAPTRKGGFQYRYDPARPEMYCPGQKWTMALQTAAGRLDPLPTSAVASTEPGSRYYRLPDSGLLGMNLMNSGMWVSVSPW